MGPLFGPLLAFVAAILIVPLSAQSNQGCSCSGVDYTNGGSYLIDGTANLNFTFTSVFNGTYCLSASFHVCRLLTYSLGCRDSLVVPVLVDPNGNDISCTTIESQPDNSEQVSQW